MLIQGRGEWGCLGNVPISWGLNWGMDVVVVPNMFLENFEHARINAKHASILTVLKTQVKPL